MTSERGHPEAYCLMTYLCEDLECKTVERLWNSRNGVTPFLIGCRRKDCAGLMKHIDWKNDIRRPAYEPRYGDRIFVDLTPARREFLARKVFAQMWASPKRTNYWPDETEEEAREAYLESMCGDGFDLADPEGTPIDTRKGEPDIRTIGRDTVWLKHIPKGATMVDLERLLVPQLYQGTIKQDLEKIADALEAGACDSLVLDEADRPELEEVLQAKLVHELDALQKKALEESLKTMRRGGRILVQDKANEVDTLFAPGIRVERRDKDGQVIECFEIPDTPTGRFHHAISWLAGMPAEEADKALVKADELRSGKLPADLLEAMRIPRGTIPAVLLEPPKDPSGRCITVDLSDEVSATDELKAEKILDDIIDSAEPIGAPPPFEGASALLDGLADGMRDELAAGRAVAIGRPDGQVSGILKMPDCVHDFTRVDANMILLVSGERVLEVKARCEKCRHRFLFCNALAKLNDDRTIVRLPVELGMLDSIKSCERCRKDHNGDGAMCAACSTELEARNAIRMRVTCKVCGHNASYRGADPTQCKKCRSKRIEVEREEYILDMCGAVLVVESLDEAMCDSGLEAELEPCPEELMESVEADEPCPGGCRNGIVRDRGELADCPVCMPAFPDKLDETELSEAVKQLEAEGGEA